MAFKFNVDRRFDVKLAYFILFLLLVPSCLFLTNELVWDDQQVLNAHAHWSVAALFGSYAIDSGSYWRPAASFLIAFPYLLGIPVWACKLISVALYFFQGCLCITIVDLQLTRNSANSRSIPLIALAMILALHPVFVETILWMSARADLLVGTFVAIGIWQLLRLRAQERQSMQASSGLVGLVWGLALTWLLCASKDPGLIWPGMALPFVAVFSYQAKGAWKHTWRGWTIGIVVGLLSYLALRYELIGAMSQWQKFRPLQTLGLTDRLELLTEFFCRSFVALFVPVVDPAPYKAVGWFAGDPAGVVVLILVAVCALSAISVRWLFSVNKAGGWLTVCAAAAIVAYAVIEAFVEPLGDSIISARYLAPSSALIYMALALVLSRKAGDEAIVNQNRFEKLCNVPVAAIFLLVILQSLSMWVSSRIVWRSELNLWENSWNMGSRNFTVTLDYSNALTVHNHPRESRQLAMDWISSHQDDKTYFKQCQFYDLAMKNSLALNDEAGAIQIARGAAPIAWCKIDLAENVAIVLMNQDCGLVLPILEKALEIGAAPAGTMPWSYDSPEAKMKLLRLGVYGEARCGKEEYAMNLLKALERLDKRWAAGGAMAQGLLKSARLSPK